MVDDDFARLLLRVSALLRRAQEKPLSPTLRSKLEALKREHEAARRKPRREEHE